LLSDKLIPQEGKKMYQHYPPEEAKGKSGISCWTITAIGLVFICVLVGALGALAVRSLPSLLPSAIIDTPAPFTPEPTYQPATPAQFGLSGQATCRNTKPPTASTWLQVAIDDAQKYQIDTLTFIWQIWQESKFNPDAVSAAGAVGIAQFLPSTAASLGIDPRDPAQSLDAAAQLDSERLSQFADRAQQLADHYGGASSHYGYGLVLAAYNAGTGAVDDAWPQSFSDQWPPDAWDWLSNMHSETRSYVPAILGCL
jgi:hypothetical protein